MSPSVNIRVGLGIDVHPFKEGRKLVLGGVTIPHSRGLDGHSDADVLIHALMDAILGACGKRDIGTFFPNTDQRFHGADSLALLAEVKTIVEADGWSVVNADITLLAEEPKIGPHIEKMISNIETTLGLALAGGRVMIKATTSEGLGFVGRGEGISAHCVVMMEKR